MGRLTKLSEVRPRESVSLDSLKRYDLQGSGRNTDLLLQAQQYWHNLEGVRKDGDRCYRYYKGDAWSDEVVVKSSRRGSVVGEEVMTEEQYIKKQGKVPLQQNFIRKLGRNIVGLYRDENKEPLCIARDKGEQRLGDTMSELLSYNWQLNNGRGLYSRGLEYFLIYGHVHHRHWYGWLKDKCDVWTTRCDVNRMFWDTSAELDDLSDARMIGYVHDLPLERVCQMFAHSGRDYQRLREVYRVCGNVGMLKSQFEQFSNRRLEDYDFLSNGDPMKCRVIEIWTLEQKPRYHCHDWLRGECYKIDEGEYREQVASVNQARLAQYEREGISTEDVPLIEAEWFMDDYWYYRFLSPTGVILQEGETPYNHKGHPFVSKLYPMINGEIRSHVSDLLDVQRMINRLVTKYDWILSASAKGNLIMAEESISDRMSLEDVAENWAKVGGVVLYKSRGGSPSPHQTSANNTHIGILELLNLQLKFVEDIASVNGALQGKQGYSGMSGTLYAQQTQNSTKGLRDLLDTYDEFVCNNAMLDIKNIQQYYDIDKVVDIVGEEAGDVTLQAEKVLRADYDLSIVESSSSPTYRERANEWVMQLLQSGLISLEQALEVGKFPFSEQLKQSLATQKEQLANGEVPGGISDELREQVEEGANMDAVNRLYAAMKKDNV